jgi:ABC-type transporter MlaC component
MAFGFGTASSLSAATLPLYNEQPITNLVRCEELGILYYRRVNLIAFAALCAIGAMMPGLTARAASPAEAVVRGAIDAMKALPATEGHPEARRKVLDSIDNALALDLLAKQALGPQWDKLNPAERRRFIALFTESLEELGYPRAAGPLSMLQINYLGTEPKSAAAEVVKTTLGNPDGGKIPLDFAVARRATRWQIVDVNMDGESLAGAVSTRIQNAVTTEGYQKLVEELQRQITEADAGH